MWEAFMERVAVQCSAVHLAVASERYRAASLPIQETLAAHCHAVVRDDSQVGGDSCTYSTTSHLNSLSETLLAIIQTTPITAKAPAIHAA